MKRILIVDDVEAMREQYAYDIARLGGYETLTASAGDEALQRLRAEPVHCVVLDLEMPRVDGFELLRTLQHEGSEVPVIVYTGTGDVERAVRAMRLGARGFVEKRDPIERLMVEIERALEHERLGGELIAEGFHTLDQIPYPERVYGYRELSRLADSGGG